MVDLFRTGTGPMAARLLGTGRRSVERPVEVAADLGIEVTRA